MSRSERELPLRSLRVALFVIVALVGCSDDAPGETMQDPLATVRRFHRTPLLELEPREPFLTFFSAEQSTSGPSHRTLGGFLARGAAPTVAGRLGNLELADMHRAYGVVSPRVYLLDTELESSHLMLQVTDDLSGTECDTLQDHLETTYGARSARDGGFAVTWSYRIARQPTGARNGPPPCHLWVAFERPKVSPLDRESARVQLADAVQVAWLRAWQDLMHRALRGEERSTVEAACRSAGFDPSHTQLLLEQVAIAY